MNHRRPPLPADWDAERGICRWCGCCIVHLLGPLKGKPNYTKRWHSQCVKEYKFLFWPAETSHMLIEERGHRCEDCGTELNKPSPINQYGWKVAEIHHLIPLVEFPHDPSDPYVAWKRENLLLLCHDCHVGPSGRHAKIREEKQPQMRFGFGTP